MPALKKILSCACLLLLASFLQAQAVLDSVQLKNVKGVPLSFSSLTKKTPLTLVCFWSVNSEPSVSELNAISAHYEKWKQGAAFNLLAVSVDEGVSPARLRGVANMNSWTFDVFSDFKGELRQVLNAGSLPQAMVLQGNQIVYQQSGFEAGSENYLFLENQEPVTDEKMRPVFN